MNLHKACFALADERAGNKCAAALRMDPRRDLSNPGPTAWVKEDHQIQTTSAPTVPVRRPSSTSMITAPSTVFAKNKPVELMEPLSSPDSTA